MKIGFRVPSIKKSLSGRTSLKKQAVNRAGLKMPNGFGVVRNPKKAVYNKENIKTAFDILIT